jgi:hypothetical protein
MRSVNLLFVFFFLFASFYTASSDGSFEISGSSPSYNSFSALKTTLDSLPIDGDFSWWKGNLHTHTLWTDGNYFPEMVAKWYKDNGYHFLSMTPHNTIHQGEKWVQPANNRYTRTSGRLQVYHRYLSAFGDEWVEEKKINDTLYVRLKPMNEYRRLFEEPNRFMLLQGEEITNAKTVHVNVHNITTAITPDKAGTASEIIQNNIDKVREYQETTRQSVFAQLNHANYKYAVSAKDLATVKGLQFTEIYNGNRGVQSEGDQFHVNLEKMWDTALAMRLLKNKEDILYGVATDDSHHYEPALEAQAAPGRGWVMVRSKYLTPEHIINAMKAGDFYASTGVELADFGVKNGAYYVAVIPEREVEYSIQFIGTYKGEDTSGSSRTDSSHEGESDFFEQQAGRILKTETGSYAAYKLTGNELYVRAKVISSKKHPNPYAEGDVEVAWTQPIVSR